MASRRRKLPPWLSGVTVGKKTKPDEMDSCSLDEDTKLETSYNPENKIQKKSLPENSTVCPPKEKQCSKGGEIEEKLSIEKVIELSYPEYTYDGSVIYAHHRNDCNIICEDIISYLKTQSDPAIGFDTEWPVTYQRGTQAKTSLIQICTSNKKCYLFHISCMNQIPVMLKQLLENSDVKKVGINVDYDFWKLEADYDLKARAIVRDSTVELSKLANRKLKSAENWSLEGLAKNLLHIRISKDPSVRKCDWSQFPLPEQQKMYAATDAAVSLLIYEKLLSLG